MKQLRETARCRPEVEKLAVAFSQLDVETYESLIREFMDSGEAKPLGILVNVCACNRVKLDPRLLAETLKVVEPMTDFSLPYRDQGPEAIDPLLAVAQEEDVLQERKAYGAIIAAELAIRHEKDRSPVRRVLKKLESRMYRPEARWMIHEALLLMDFENRDDIRIPFETEQHVLDVLPEEKPPILIGQGYSVRRPVRKLGRNAPCHCGSGNKYKKCCYEKDQETLRDASPYEGITMTQVRSAPGLVHDTQIIEHMRAYELKKLDPAMLNEVQLLAAYRRADLFGLREIALSMLLELKGRPGKEDFAVEHMEDLLYSALWAHDGKVARRIREQIPAEKLHEPESVELQFEVVENRDVFARLEEQFRKAFVEDHSPGWEDPLLGLAYNFENVFPALSMLFARAAIVSNPHREFDNEALLDVIQNARTELDLEALPDPVEDYFYWVMDKSESELEEEAKSKEIEDFKERLSEAKRWAAEKTSELQKKEQELAALTKKMNERAEAGPEVAHRSELAGKSPTNGGETRRKLRQQVEDLKLEIRAQQQARRQLREELLMEKKKLKTQQEKVYKEEMFPETEATIEYERMPKKILLPEFTVAFRRSCESMPASIVAKALRAASGFAAHDTHIWGETKWIKRIPGVLRIRVAKDHRLLIRWEKEVRLEILDLIQRSDLETWIRQHSG
jgi:hypothetical protein